MLKCDPAPGSVPVVAHAWTLSRKPASVRRAARHFHLEVVSAPRVAGQREVVAVTGFTGACIPSSNRTSPGAPVCAMEAGSATASARKVCVFGKRVYCRGVYRHEGGDGEA